MQSNETLYFQVRVCFVIPYANLCSVALCYDEPLCQNIGNLHAA